MSTSYEDTFERGYRKITGKKGLYLAIAIITVILGLITYFEYRKRKKVVAGGGKYRPKIRVIIPYILTVLLVIFLIINRNNPDVLSGNFMKKFEGLRFLGHV